MSRAGPLQLDSGKGAAHGQRRVATVSVNGCCVVVVLVAVVVAVVVVIVVVVVVVVFFLVSVVVLWILLFLFIRPRRQSQLLAPQARKYLQ